MFDASRFRSVFGLVTATLFVVIAAWPVEASIYLNEISLNNESTDNGEEFFELYSTTGGVEAMTGLTFLVIDGDGGASGSIDVALSLDGFSTGTNGLFLWRDSSLVLNPAPDAATTLNVMDFDPDIENGSATFAIVSGFTGMIGDDLDTDDDGVIDAALPWTSVIDVVGEVDSDVDNIYAAALGGVDIALATYGSDSIVRLSDMGEWISVDIDETASELPGPYYFDDTQAQRADGTPFTPSTDLTFNYLTPGGMNPANIPEPTTLALVGIGALAAGAARRRR